MNRTLSTAAIAALLVAIASPAAAGAERSDLSLHGRATAAAPSARQVDVDQVRVVNVDCGDTVTFRKGDKTFSWKFDSLQHRAVDLRTLAPAGFADKPLMVYIARNEAERN